jgi:putative PIN family toxin of toxin-antitoxin system
MLVVIDTNVMLSAFARQSPIAVLFRALAAGRLRLAVTAAIVLEYEEISARRGGAGFSARVMHWLSLVAAAHKTIELVQPSFQFHVVTSDPDDNKFTDCAIVADADFVITNDSDFAPLADAGYKPQPIKPEAFIAKYLTP